MSAQSSFSPEDADLANFGGLSTADLCTPCHERHSFDGRLITVEMLGVYYFVVLMSTRQIVVSHGLLRVSAVRPSRFICDRAISLAVSVSISARTFNGVP